MKRLVTVVVTALVLAARTAGSYTFLDRPFGTPQVGSSPRAAALGGAGAALSSGAFALVDNPAQLARARGSRLDFAGRLARVSENRFVPLYDTFDAFVEEAAIAVNDHLYGGAAGGVVYDRGGPVVLSAGVFDRYDPRYDYYDERRTTAASDLIIAERWIRTRGVLRSLGLGAAFPIQDRGSVGIAIHRYDGTIIHRFVTVPRTGAATPADTVTRHRLSGVTAVLGGAFRVNERLDLGVAVETGPRLDDDVARWENGALQTGAPAADPVYPWRIQGGASYRPRNAMRATFVADLVYLGWSHTNLRLADGTKPRDAWDLRFGVEHVYYNALPGRMGFRYGRSYAARDADQATFTLGLGLKADRATIDVSGEIGKRVSRQNPLWPRDPAYASVGAGRDRVDDTVLGVTVGVGTGW